MSLNIRWTTTRKAEKYLVWSALICEVWSLHRTEVWCCLTHEELCLHLLLHRRLQPHCQGKLFNIMWQTCRITQQVCTFIWILTDVDLNHFYCFCYFTSVHGSCKSRKWQCQFLGSINQRKEWGYNHDLVIVLLPDQIRYSLVLNLKYNHCQVNKVHSILFYA